MSLVLLTHPECELHFMGDGHPESPRRLRAIDSHIRTAGLDRHISRELAPAIDRELLHLVHDRDYVSAIFDASPIAEPVWLDPDTAMNAHSLAAARHAAGAGIKAVDMIMAGQADRTFCAVRPPGHHAERDRCMGFCFFNNIAVAAAYALKRYGLDRVAIIDFDVHHGNGTEDVFRNEPRVLFCSTFQHPFYPFSGTGSHGDHIINTPLKPGSGSAAFREAVSRDWLPALVNRRPALILISAGFDGHREDPLANLGLVEDDYAWVTREIRKVADSHCQGRVISFLEGGYDLDALGRSVAAHLGELL